MKIQIVSFEKQNPFIKGNEVVFSLMYFKSLPNTSLKKNKLYKIKEIIKLDVRSTTRMGDYAFFLEGNPHDLFNIYWFKRGRYKKI